MWLTEGPALEAVLASAALPAIFPSVELEGNRYIDGGVVDNTPLSVALAAGARRIYVLLSGGIQARSYDVVRPYEALLVAFGLSIRTRLRRDLAAIPADVDVIVLEQSGVEELLWQDFSRTEELLERGYLTRESSSIGSRSSLPSAPGCAPERDGGPGLTAGPRSREEGPGPSAYSDDAAAPSLDGSAAGSRRTAPAPAPPPASETGARGNSSARPRSRGCRRAPDGRSPSAVWRRRRRGTSACRAPSRSRRRSTGSGSTRRAPACTA